MPSACAVRPRLGVAIFPMSDHQFTESVLMAFGLDDMDMHVHEAFDKLADMFDVAAKAEKVNA